MGSGQVIARDLRRALAELRDIEKAGALSPETKLILAAMTRLLEMLRRKILRMG